VGGHHFISYSPADGAELALRLAGALEDGEPRFRAWLDRRDLRPGSDFDRQLVEAIRTCDSSIFVMTPDSVEDRSVCKAEWTLAMAHAKPVVPLLAVRGTEIPFRLRNQQYLDFTGAFDTAVERLRRHLEWLESPEGQEQVRRDRLEDARRRRRRADDPAERARLEEEAARLERQAHPPQAAQASQAAEQPRRYDRAAVRRLIREALSDEELTGLCLDHFPEVYEGFAAGMSRNQKILNLVQPCPIAI
jgi:hypothetical protein